MNRSFDIIDLLKTSLTPFTSIEPDLPLKLQTHLSSSPGLPFFFAFVAKF